MRGAGRVKASAGAATAAATAAGVATGASAAKAAGGLAALLALCLLGYFLFNSWFQPFTTQDITGKSTFTTANSVSNELPTTEAAPQPQDAVAPAASTDTAASSSLPVYPEVFGLVTGTVSYEDGTPAPGAKVLLDNTPKVDRREKMLAEGYKLEPLEVLQLTTTTDSAGRYSISGIRVSRSADEFMQYVVSASKGDLFGQALIYAEHLQREIRVDLTLRPEFSVGGIVRTGSGSR